jgi:RNA polymerase sigma-70 factor (ECF subfamily)
MSDQLVAPITALLKRATSGDPAAEAELATAVYSELRRIAARFMRSERPEHTLQPTALVHEAYLKLLNQKDVDWQNRAHFYGVAAKTMRHILVDYARKARAAKRVGQLGRITFNEDLVRSEDPSADLLALNEALERLYELDRRGHTVVTLRFFGGFEMDEIAEMLGVSVRTVKRDWTVARAWLRLHLQA